MVGFSFAAALSLLAGSTYARDSSTDERLVERSKPFKYTPLPHPPYPKVASTWYAGYHGGPEDFPPEDLSYQKYTNIAYSFVVPDPDVPHTSVNVSDDPILRKVVHYAHEVGTTVSICVGGGAGSQYWSGAVSTPIKRLQLVHAIIDIVQRYDLDGVDFDWEYPNNAGIGCNEYSPQDTANFLQFIKDLRESALPWYKTLSAATALLPFLGPDGNPSEDVSEFAKYLNYIEVMNYDVWGPWTPTAGPNSPLNDSCASDPSTQAIGSAVQGVTSWAAAGFPLDQIVLGVGSYGHSYNVTPDNAFTHVMKNGTTTLGTTLNNSFPVFDAVNIPVGDVWDQAPFIDQCGVAELQGGVFDFWGLVTGGFLDKKGNPNPGISYMYDPCAQTPTVYNATSHIWVEYDNAESFTAKGKYIKSTGLRGFAMWEAGGDYNDILIDAIRSGASLGTPTHPDPVTTSRVYPSATPQ